MFSRVLSSTAVALATFQVVSAQTSTDCNPMEKVCPDDPAIGGSVTVDFTQGENDLFVALAGTTIQYTDQGAVFSIEKATQAPTMESTKYIFGGRIDAEIQAAPGAGIISSFVLESDDLDEIDWEWVGNDYSQAQTNYFGKGNDTTWDRGGFSDVANSQTSVHTYSIDWDYTSYVRWYIDGTMVRELLYADAQGGSQFPQTPMKIKLGTWCTANSAEGTIEWGGGPTDFSQAPFLAYYKSLKITDKAGGKGDQAVKYKWQSPGPGSWESITVVTGDGDDTPSSSSASSSATPTSTSTSKPTGSSTSTSEPTSTTSSDASSTTKTSATSATSSSSPTATDSSSTSATSTPTGTDSSSTPSATPSPSTVPDNAGLKTALSPVLFVAGLLAAAAL